MEAKCKGCGKRFEFFWPATRQIACSRECRLREYQQRRRDHINQKSREHYWKNPERAREIKRKWNNSPNGVKNRAEWFKAHYEEYYERLKARGGIKPLSARVTSLRRLKRSGRPKICVYKAPHSGRIECHHKDHDPFNMRLSNLAWVCRYHHALHHRLTSTTRRAPRHKVGGS